MNKRFFRNKLIDFQLWRCLNDVTITSSSKKKNWCCSLLCFVFCSLYTTSFSFSYFSFFSFYPSLPFYFYYCYCYFLSLNFWCKFLSVCYSCWCDPKNLITQWSMTHISLDDNNNFIVNTWWPKNSPVYFVQKI